MPNRLTIYSLANPGAPGGRLTLSLGLACLSPSARQGPQELLDLADRALYQAKAGGRNQVVCALQPAED